MQCNKSAKKITIIICLTSMSIGLTVGAVFVPGLIAPAVASTLATASVLKSFLKSRNQQNDNDQTRNDSNSDDSSDNNRNFCMQAFRKINHQHNHIHSNVSQASNDAGDRNTETKESVLETHRKNDNVKFTTHVFASLEHVAPTSFEKIKRGNHEYKVVDNRTKNSNKM